MTGTTWVGTTGTTGMMETTWGPSGGYGDDVGMTGTMQGQCGDDGDHVGMTGTTGTTKSLKMP